MITTDLLSSLLLQLYQASRELTMGEFQEFALRLIEQHIPFDGVWWAMSTQVNKKYHVHGSFIRGLPDDCTDLLNQTPGKNIVAKSCSENSGVTLIFGPEKLNENFETAFLANHMDTRHCMCTETNDPLLGLSTFLSLTRRADERPFSEAERQLKQLIIPHINAMLNINRISQITRIRACSPERRSVIAVTDTKGIIHTAEPDFDFQIQREWPGWNGPFLPPLLLAAIAKKNERFSGAKINASFFWMENLILVTLTEYSRLDLLTARERTIARAFSAGSSYKEVAKQLNLSPATVRHHLRSIYEKVDVTDKAELARLVFLTAAD